MNKNLYLQINKVLTTLIIVSTLIFFTGCKKKKKIPDVSNIKVELSTQRFEQDFFAMDTNKLNTDLQTLFEKYPSFSIDYLYNILAVPSHPDSIMQTVKLFRRAYSNVYEDSKKVFTDFS